jgi:Uncharacterized protein conserved in bacteria (DUF2325)
LEITILLIGEIVSAQIANGSFAHSFWPAGPELPWLDPSGRLALRELNIERKVEKLLLRPVHGRRKIWEFGTHLHCSIIGTCLSTSELRHVLLKLGVREAADGSDHDLHASAVLIAGKHQEGAKLLHKALDRRHRLAINQFERTKNRTEVRSRWQEAAQQGEIPGAYWAALTHPATDDALVKEIFAEVHMLSHLVGAANRADIRRLRQLEAENAELQAKVARQQQQLRDAVVSRDETIAQLTYALERHLANDRGESTQPVADADGAAWKTLAADLERRLSSAKERCARAESQFEESRSALTTEASKRLASERREQQLRTELEAMEANFASLTGPSSNRPETPALTNLTLLYVGGRQDRIGHLRALAEDCGAVLLHHDGGIEERGGLLAGLVSRADAVLFPVDCVSHSAMSMAKRLCRQSGKPFLPLRSDGLAPFCAVLGSAALSAPASSSEHDE